MKESPPKPLFWVASSRKDMKSFPSRVRRAFGFALWITMRNGKGKKTRPARKAMVEASSGNVFRDLALPNADELLAKAQLVERIRERIEDREMSQRQASSVLGIDQPKVSALLSGKLNGFSIGRLCRFLNALGENVEIVLRPGSSRKNRATTSVRLAR